MGIDSQKLPAGLALVAANYAKRLLEDPYDKLFQTEFGQRLKGLDGNLKHAIELALYIMTAFFDEKLKEDSALKKFVKEVGLDAPPELTKRMINGAVGKLKSHASSPAERGLVDMLTELDDQSLADALNWLYAREPQDRSVAFQRLLSLSVDELRALRARPPAVRAMLLELLTPSVGGSGQLSAKVTEDIGKATEKLQKLSRRIRGEG